MASSSTRWLQQRGPATLTAAHSSSGAFSGSSPASAHVVLRAPAPFIFFGLRAWMALTARAMQHRVALRDLRVHMAARQLSRRRQGGAGAARVDFCPIRGRREIRWRGAFPGRNCCFDMITARLFVATSQRRRVICVLGIHHVATFATLAYLNRLQATAAPATEVFLSPICICISFACPCPCSPPCVLDTAIAICGETV